MTCKEAIVILFVGASLLVGCAHQAPITREVAVPPPQPVAVPEVPATPKPQALEPIHMTLGESIKRRPIELSVFGTGPINVLILGGIHGDETTTVDLTRNLIELLKTDASLYGGRRVAIIPVANPDGYAAKTRTNSRKVDLNRNFPARNFDDSRGNAVSEPETKAILDAITYVKPHLIISIHSISRGRECNNYDGPADGIASVMSRYNNYPAKENIGYPTPGSMGSYCGKDLQIPMITLELPKTQAGDEAWEDNREAILTAIRAAH